MDKLKDMLAVGLLSVLAVVAYTQSLLYNYSFDSDLQGWTPIGVRSSDLLHNSDALWIWTADGTSNGAFAGSQGILSESGGGAVLFDSDYLDNGGSPTEFGNGPAPSPQRGDLISPNLDFNSQDRVILTFHQFYRYYSKNGVDFNTPNSNLQVSIDEGLTWDSIQINDEIYTNNSTDRNDIQLVDISQYAAHQPSVKVKFVWDGDYYFWIVDDIRFYDEIGSELEILAVTVPDNYVSPQYLFINDSVDLEIHIRNNGDLVSTNIEVLVEIRDQNLVLFYSQSSSLGSLFPGSDIIYDFPNDFSPGLLAQGEYFLKYTVYSIDFSDVDISNNEKVLSFHISDGLLKKAPDPPSGTGLFYQNSDFSFANIFEIPREVPQRKVNTFWLNCSAVGATLEGKLVRAYLVELPPDIKREGENLLNKEIDLVNFDPSIDISSMQNMGWVIGQGERLFTNADPTSGNFSISLSGSNGMDILMKSGRTYLAIASYINANGEIAQGFSETYPLYQLSTIVKSTGGWGLSVNYHESVAGIYLETEIVPSQEANYCINAKVLESNGIVSSDGPVDGRGCHMCDQAIRADWYYFDALEAGTIYINSCFFGVDTRLFVYSGNCDDLIPMTFGDNECLDALEGNNIATSVSLVAQSNTRYYFEWDDRWSDSDFKFEFIFMPDVGNCAVSNNGDTGEGSLRNAIDCAEPGDTVYISSLLSGDSICLESGKIIISKDVTIIGHPYYDIPIDGTQQSQAIEITPNATVFFQDVHLIVHPGVNINAIENFGDLKLKDVLIQYKSGSGDGIFFSEGKVQMDPEVIIEEIY